jgi:hypothetical protein
LITPKLSTLISVDVRLVWPKEAADFTPWLLAHSEILGDALGISLELSVAEHKVGDFSLDLIGRDVDTEEVVIIENQFGQTDHRHLGQLLTYAGGTEPATVVWIAETFRDEHRAALDWLNLRTDSSARFFGVQLRAVSLEGAPGLAAPLLDVVAKPNDWGKAVKKATAGVATEREQLYLEFWTDWLTRVSKRGWTNRKAQPRHLMYLPSGVKRVRYTVSFRNDGMLSELYFNHRDPDVNLARWEVLFDKRAALEAAFGGALTFDDLPNNKGCRVGVVRTGKESVDDRDAWPDYMAWFEDTQVRLRKAVQAVGGIPPLPAGSSLDDEDGSLDEGDAEEDLGS